MITRFKVDNIDDLTLKQLRLDMIKIKFPYHFCDENNDRIEIDEEENFYAIDIIQEENRINLRPSELEIPTTFNSRKEYSDFFNLLSTAEYEMEKLVDENMFKGRFVFDEINCSPISRRMIIRMRVGANIKN
jgi:hypothetical protein